MKHPEFLSSYTATTESGKISSSACSSLFHYNNPEPRFRIICLCPTVCLIPHISEAYRLLLHLYINHTPFTILHHHSYYAHSWYFHHRYFFWRAYNNIVNSHISYSVVVHICLSTFHRSSQNLLKLLFFSFAFCIL